MTSPSFDPNEAIRQYGQGDNSVTDRMWYESALAICGAVGRAEQTQGAMLSDQQMIPVILPLLPQEIRDPKKRQIASDMLARQFDSNYSWGRGSRFMVENIRRSLHNFMELQDLKTP